MITIETIARELDVTTETVIVLVDQIVNDADLWDVGMQLLTEAGAEVIRDQVTMDPAVTGMDVSLDAVDEATIALENARAAAEDAEQGFRAAIRAAVDKGHPRYRVAERAGLTPQRVGQIYDGHR